MVYTLYLLVLIRKVIKHIEKYSGNEFNPTCKAIIRHSIQQGALIKNITMGYSVDCNVIGALGNTCSMTLLLHQHVASCHNTSY